MKNKNSKQAAISTNWLLSAIPIDVTEQFGERKIRQMIQQQAAQAKPVVKQGAA